MRPELLPNIFANNTSSTILGFGTTGVAGLFTLGSGLSLSVGNVLSVSAGSGDMILASAQTNSGAKTFLDTTFLLRNVANTFNGSFVNTNTANRVYTLKDANGTLAFTSDITGDLVGPASATDNAIARFDTTTGKLIQNSTLTISDAGHISAGTNNNLILAPDGNGIVVARQGVFIRNAITSQTDELNILINGSGGVFSSLSTVRSAGSINTYFSISLATGIAGSTKGQNFILSAGDGFTNSDGGDIFLNSGLKNGSGKDGNIGLLTIAQATNFQSMEKGLFVANRTTVPTAAPTAGFFHYSNSGVPTWRTSTDNTIFLEKQAAVTTQQGIADALTTLGLLTASTISGGGSGITRTIIVTSGNVTMGATASVDYVYIVNGAHTPTLPTAVGNTNEYTVQNSHSATITVNTTSSQTINGDLTITVLPNESRKFISNTTNWIIV